MHTARKHKKKRLSQLFGVVTDAFIYSTESLVSANMISPKIAVIPTAIAIKNTMSHASLPNSRILLTIIVPSYRFD